MSNRKKLKTTRHYPLAISRQYYVAADSELGKKLKEYFDLCGSCAKEASDAVRALCDGTALGIPYSSDLVVITDINAEAGGLMGIVTSPDYEAWHTIDRDVFACMPLGNGEELLWHPRVCGGTVIETDDCLPDYPYQLPDNYAKTDAYAFASQLDEEWGKLHVVRHGTLASLLKVRSQFNQPSKEQLMRDGRNLNWERTEDGYIFTTTGAVITHPDAVTL